MTKEVTPYDKDHVIDLGFDKIYEIKLDFSDPTELSKILDWMWNSGDFATLNMTEETIEKARKLGLKVTKKESSHD